ncbi:MAG: hypothetical protein H6506_01375 [Calditrichaeota bacterium]|nr:hypothetical protein [Calditrichota bacterium]MCB9366460.1 hypothetical protein [Calditrichota bacterium]MCB9391282.1 hypothetical protein [Calditrichota bacterium]
MKRVTLSLLFGVLLVSAQANARRTSFPTLDWGLRVGVNAIYNDNVLRLSEADGNAFHRFDPGFRTPLQTLDDGEMEILLAASLQWRAPATTMVNLNYRIKAVQRAQNSVTDYQTHSLGASIRPRVRGYRWIARGSVFTIPSFYLRVYRDRDFGTYDDCRFENWEYNGEFSYRIAEPLWLSAMAGYGTYYYGARFTEYDSEYKEFGAEAEYTTRWDPRLAFRYTRRVSDNLVSTQSLSLVDETGAQLLEDSEYGDGDFNEDEFRVSLKSRVRALHPHTVNASLVTRIRRRVYTTDRTLEADPFHRGRLDTRWDVTPTLDWSVSSALDVSLFFTYEERSTESDYEPLALVKNFVRREVGLGFTYRIR